MGVACLPNFCILLNKFFFWSSTNMRPNNLIWSCSALNLMELIPYFYGLVGEVGDNDSLFWISWACSLLHHIIFISLIVGYGFCVVCGHFGCQTHLLLDWTSKGWCVVLPSLLKFDVCGNNNTSLETLTKLVKSSCMVALGTHLYSLEYVSPIT